jgi:hypothetical protein
LELIQARVGRTTNFTGTFTLSGWCFEVEIIVTDTVWRVHVIGNIITTSNIGWITVRDECSAYGTGTITGLHLPNTIDLLMIEIDIEKKVTSNVK